MNRSVSRVGAGRAAMEILDRLNPHLRDPAGQVVRFWGFLMWLVVFYIYIVSTNRGGPIVAWMVVYLVYLFLLEILRRTRESGYDWPVFRLVRIATNLVLITWLVAIVPQSRYLFAFFYTVPIFAAIVYFTDQIWLAVLAFALSAAGLYRFAGPLASENPLNALQYLVVIVALASTSILMWYFHKKAALASNELAEISWELQKEFDLQALMQNIIQIILRLSGAGRAMVILVDPKRPGIVNHCWQGFELRPGYLIEDLAQDCVVIKNGESYNNVDIHKTFGGKSLYDKYFTSSPRSILAEPIKNGKGHTIGMLSVADDKPKRFDNFTRNLLREFSLTVSSAIENSLVYRRARLDGARSRYASDLLIDPLSEEEIYRRLVEEACNQITTAQVCVLHVYNPYKDLLEPVASFDRVQNKIQIDHLSAEDGYDSFRFGEGVAGHCLILQEPILISDVAHHRIFQPSLTGVSFNSLLVAPLIESRTGVPIGTLSLSNQQANAFNANDEAVLAALAQQGAMAFNRLKTLIESRKQNELIKSFFQEILNPKLDERKDEVELCQQIVNIAVKVLPFKLARLRLLDPETNELVSMGFAGIDEEVAHHCQGQHFPFAALQPFLVSDYQWRQCYLMPNDSPEWHEFADQYFYVPSEGSVHPEGWQAYDSLISPLKTLSGAIIGVLTLDQPENQRRPDESLMEAIDMFSSLVAWSIELSRTRQRLADQYKLMAAFIGSISEELAHSRNLDTLDSLVVQVGGKLLNAEGCSLYKVEGDKLYLASSNFLADTHYIGRQKKVSTAERCGLTAFVAATGQPLVYNNGEHRNDPHWAGEEEQLQYLPSKICSSLLIVPVTNRHGDVTGVLKLENKVMAGHLDEFTSKDLQLLELLALQFARAEQIVGSYQELQTQEHKGLGDDLHDLFNWYHNGVVLPVDALEYWFMHGNMEKAKELLPGLVRNAYAIQDGLKTIHTAVINQFLEIENFKKALESMVAAWNMRVSRTYPQNLPIQIHCPEQLSLPVALRSALLRIVNEATGNAILHSGVLQRPEIPIRIQVEQNQTGLFLEVIDQGVGMDTIIEGYGISRMHHIAKTLTDNYKIDTEVEVISKKDRGTTVKVRAFYAGGGLEPV